MEADALRLELSGSSREKIAEVESKFPKQVRKKRVIEGSNIEEDYLDYIFPDDEKKLSKLSNIVLFVALLIYIFVLTFC